MIRSLWRMQIKTEQAIMASVRLTDMKMEKEKGVADFPVEAHEGHWESVSVDIQIGGSGQLSARLRLSITNILLFSLRTFRELDSKDLYSDVFFEILEGL